MSKKNPYKKKRKQASAQILFFGEGFSEAIFLKHLKKLYSYNSGIAVTVKKGKGGCPRDIVIDATKIPGDFNRRIVVFDNDKPTEEMQKARQEAKKRKVELIENTPCLESLFLSILGKRRKMKKSKECKKEFETKYIEKKKRSEPSKYEELFPKKILDSQRKKISELDKLIGIMEGK